MKDKYISKCCKAKLDYKYGGEGTNHAICTACNQPCDWVVTNSIKVENGDENEYLSDCCNSPVVIKEGKTYKCCSKCGLHCKTVIKNTNPTKVDKCIQVEPNQKLDQTQDSVQVEERFRNNYLEFTDGGVLVKYVGNNGIDIDDFIKQEITTAREEELDDIEKWAYGNGITDKKSFRLLINHLKERKLNLLKEKHD
jgi:hypothetical protein